MPPICMGQQCQKGQNCWDPESLTSGSLTGNAQTSPCTCAPGITSSATGEVIQDDSCEPFGLVCDVADFYNPTVTACRMPREFDLCFKSVGCDDGLDCQPSFFDGDGDRYRCVRKCTRTSDCPDPQMKCWPNDSPYPPGLKLHCYFNLWCATDTTSGNIDPTKFFSSCAASASSDGQCIPVSNSTTGEANDICQQTGTVASGGICDPNAKRPATDTMCPGGEYCEAVQPGAAAGEVKGICRKLCNAAPAGAARKPALDCGTDKICTDESNPNPNWTLGKDARIGYCRGACQLLGTANTCTTDALSNDEICGFNYGLGGETGACRPVRTDAAASGGECTGLTETDLRFDCTDRLICLLGEGADNRCHKFCDISVCTDENADCAQCNAGQTCTKTEDNQTAATNKLGICR